MTLLQTSATLQPNTAAIGERASSSPSGPPEQPAPRKDTPLSRAQDARSYQQAFFLLRDIAQSEAHLMTLEVWQIVRRIQEYCAYRYNSITLAGTEFAPKPWIASGRML